MASFSLRTLFVFIAAVAVCVGYPRAAVACLAVLGLLVPVGWYSAAAVGFGAGVWVGLGLTYVALLLTTPRSLLRETPVVADEWLVGYALGLLCLATAFGFLGRHVAARIAQAEEAQAKLDAEAAALALQTSGPEAAGAESEGPD